MSVGNHEHSLSTVEDRDELANLYKKDALGDDGTASTPPSTLSMAQITMAASTTMDTGDSLTIRNGIHFKSEPSANACITVDPRSDNHKKWDIYVAILLIYTAYVTPYEVAFLSTRLNVLFCINFVVNISFFADMVKSFFTAFYDSERQLWVGDSDKIVTTYLKGWFAIDLVSILPFDSVGLFMDSDALAKFKAARIIRLLRLLKLLRLLRSMRMFARWQDAFGLTNAFKTLMKFLLIIITSTHWMACILRLLPDLFPYDKPGMSSTTDGEAPQISGMSIRCPKARLRVKPSRMQDLPASTLLHLLGHDDTDNDRIR
jgi:hypothetical protein